MSSLQTIAPRLAPAPAVAARPASPRPGTLRGGGSARGLDYPGVGGASPASSSLSPSVACPVSRAAVACAVAACAVGALALRLVLARRSGLWIDEAQLIWTIRLAGVGDVIDFVANHDSHPPLFYLLMRGWLWAFGDTEAAALAPGILLGVGIVVAMYWAGARFFTPATGLIAAALAACSPLLARHSAEARPYSLMAALCLASTYALWSALRDRPDAPGSAGRLRSWAVYVVAVAAMLLTHNWAWLVWGGHGVVVLAWWAVRGPGPGGWASARTAVLAQLVVAAACAPWVPTLLYQARHAGHGPAAVTLQGFTRTVSSLVFSFPGTGRTYALALLLAAVAWRPLLGVAQRVVARRRGTRAGAGGGTDADADMTTVGNAGAPAVGPDAALGLALCLGAPLVAAAAAAAMSWRNNLLVPHSLTVISPCLILAVAHLIARLPQLGPRGLPLVCRATPAVLATAVLAAAHVRMLADDTFVKSNAREVAAAVAARATPDDLTLVLPQWYGSSFYYYYPMDRPRIDYPSADFTGAFEYDDVAQRFESPDAIARLRGQLLDARRQGRRVWVVTDRRWTDPAAGGQHPAHLCAGAYRKVAFARAAEIRALLDTLYGGPPRADAIPPDPRTGWSMMDALLYAPPAAPGDGSTFAQVRGGAGAGADVPPRVPAAEHASVADDR